MSERERIVKNRKGEKKLPLGAAVFFVRLVFVFGFSHFVLALIDERNDEIHAYDYEVENVKPENVRQSGSGGYGTGYFTDYSANITDDDYDGKNYAFSFCRSGLDAFYDRNRPRNSETYEH